ncbi:MULTISPECIES: hypothetical protein [Acidobacterium]|uniref:Uncharacterized protein n=1 Tax=Acidobacterium capsulatum (strain ATCC 51196 / DSM 11244 / BCRC 80197 / JCM 7670 / NBRC 15755 / NCIMB 13165 / 161) TaxID=240015 RepID=C1FA23_ACIC5|nr:MULTISPECIES: hypothetical protein [Acidobacterium]ACO32805.1 hypothetical protein ACP_0404 [Acidobacterium capsulatum ATCC 51196]HCT62053.1 hypothetical protein [Acidobacterium sp.]
MANIYTEGKGPKGITVKESLLPNAVAGYSRGLAVSYGADSSHCVLLQPGVQALGLLEEDAIDAGQACAVIEFGQAVAQIGANITAQQPLTTNAAGQLVPAQPGQPIAAIALETQVYVAPGSFATVFVVAALNISMPGDAVTHYVAAGAIPVAEGAAGLGGGAALAMTLALPTEAQDGTKIFITAESSEAHTVTTAANGINGAKHVVTFATRGDGVVLEAMGGVWNVRSLVGGAAIA